MPVIFHDRDGGEEDRDDPDACHASPSSAHADE
jgi:hypothetical protein